MKTSYYLGIVFVIIISYVSLVDHVNKIEKEIKKVHENIEKTQKCRNCVHINDSLNIVFRNNVSILTKDAALDGDTVYPVYYKR